MKNWHLFVLIFLVVFSGTFEVTAKGAAESSIPSDSNNSPFGIGINVITRNQQDLAEINNIGGSWIRAMGKSGMAWDFVEKVKGEYDWSTRDELARLWQKHQLNVLWTIIGFSKWDQGVTKPNRMAPRDMDSFINFISKAAERYDGDGKDDAPGSPIVNYWQVENEIDFKRFWRDAPQKYVEYLRRTSQAIKKSNPNAKIVLAGATSPQGFNRYYVDVLALLSKYREEYFDIIDIHWYGNAGEYRTYENKIGEKTLVSSPEVLLGIQETLRGYGYDDIPVWFTEIGTHNNKAAGNFPHQTEKEQAVSLLKRYVYQISHGVKKLFWFTVTEVPFDPKNNFAYIGLINNPEVNSKGQSNGLSHKKLAYYTYKLMTSKLEGANWTSIGRIKEGNGVYIYKFLKKGAGLPVWVAWSDNPKVQPVQIDIIEYDKVKITRAVPAYEAGNQVVDYKSAFKVETKIVVEHKLSVELGLEPIFIESCDAGCRAFTPSVSLIPPAKSDNGELFRKNYSRNEKKQFAENFTGNSRNSFERRRPRRDRRPGLPDGFVQRVREEVSREKTTSVTLQERYRVLMVWGRQLKMEGANIGEVFPLEAARRLEGLVNNRAKTEEACRQVDDIYRQLGELAAEKY